MSPFTKRSAVHRHRQHRDVRRDRRTSRQRQRRRPWPGAALPVLHDPHRQRRQPLRHPAFGGQRQRLGEGGAGPLPRRQEQPGGARLQPLPVAVRCLDSARSCPTPRRAAPESARRTCRARCRRSPPRQRRPSSSFANVSYSGTNDDGAGTGLDRTKEGYFEIIEMATYSSPSTTGKAITHVNGVPPCTSMPPCGNSPERHAGCLGRAAAERRPVRRR